VKKATQIKIMKAGSYDEACENFDLDIHFKDVHVDFIEANFYLI